MKKAPEIVSSSGSPLVDGMVQARLDFAAGINRPDEAAAQIFYGD